MGEVYTWKGKHFDGHLDLQTSHTDRPFEITAHIVDHPVHGILLEGGAKLEEFQRLGVPKIDRNPYAALIDNTTELARQCEKTGTDLWVGDEDVEKHALGWSIYDADDVVLPIGPAVLLASIYQLYRMGKRKEAPTTRRAVLKKMLAAGAVIGAAGTAPFFSQKIIEKSGRPTVNWAGRYIRKVLQPHIIKNRDEFAAARMNYIADYYRNKTKGRAQVGSVYVDENTKNPNEKPQIGGEWGGLHASIAQLVDDDANTLKVKSKCRDDPRKGFLWRLHFDRVTKQWSVEKHHLLGPDFLKAHPNLRAIQEENND